MLYLIFWKKFFDSDKFRVIIPSVEATVPRPDIEKQEEKKIKRKTVKNG